MEAAIVTDLQDRVHLSPVRNTFSDVFRLVGPAESSMSLPPFSLRWFIVVKRTACKISWKRRVAAWKETRCEDQASSEK